jgi:glycosyltransferase involved in cell wall biosynthesis
MTPDRDCLPRLLSVVMPAFNEEANVAEAILRTSQAVEKLGCPWEIVVVDDGSEDGTFAELRRCSATDARVRAVRLSRNFGSHVAISAGFDHAEGDVCLVITADMEEPADLIPAFLDKWREGYEIVWGIRAERHESARVRAGSSMFHWLSRVAGLPNRSGAAIGGGFFLIDGRVRSALRRMKERNRNLVALLLWMGFRQASVEYRPRVRSSGRSKWTLARRLKLVIDSFVSFSYLPIRVVSALGVVISSLSFVYGAAIVVAAILGGASVQGWPTLMATMLFLGGVQLLVTGMLGEYIWRALDEARARPLYVLAETVGINPEGQGTDSST